MPETRVTASRNNRFSSGNSCSKRSSGAPINSPAVTLPSALKIGAAMPAAPGTVSPMLMPNPSRRIVCKRCRSFATTPSRWRRTAASRRGIPVAIFGHAGDGHVHVNALPDLTVSGWRDTLAALYADAATLLLRLGGTPSGEHGVGRLRAGLLERFYGPEVMALFRGLKRAYDSRSLLNPGVIIPSADWAPLVDLKVGPEAAPIPDDIARRLRELEQTAGWATPKLDLATPSP